VYINIRLGIEATLLEVTTNSSYYFTFLGTILFNDWRWENNTDAVVNKAQKRMYFLGQLTKFGPRREILVQFYRSASESILAFSISRIISGISQRQRSRLVDRDLTTLTVINNDRSKKRTDNIIFSDHTHPAHHLFE